MGIHRKNIRPAQQLEHDPPGILRHLLALLRRRRPPGVHRTHPTKCVQPYRRKTSLACHTVSTHGKNYTTTAAGNLLFTNHELEHRTVDKVEKEIPHISDPSQFGGMKIAMHAMRPHAKKNFFGKIDHWQARFHADTNYLCASRLSGRHYCLHLWHFALRHFRRPLRK